MNRLLTPKGFNNRAIKRSAASPIPGKKQVYALTRRIEEVDGRQFLIVEPRIKEKQSSR